MKILASHILALFYTILSFGININLHLCQGKVKSIHIVQEVDDLSCHILENACCEKRKGDGQGQNPSCCSHENYHLVVDDFKAPIKDNHFCCLNSFTAISYIIEVESTSKEVSDYSFTPPPNIPLYLKEQRFTLYG